MPLPAAVGANRTTSQAAVTVAMAARRMNKTEPTNGQSCRVNINAVLRFPPASRVRRKAPARMPVPKPAIAATNMEASQVRIVESRLSLIRLPTETSLENHKRHLSKSAAKVAGD